MNWFLPARVTADPFFMIRRTQLWWQLNLKTLGLRNDFKNDDVDDDTNDDDDSNDDDDAKSR